MALRNSVAVMELGSVDPDVGYSGYSYTDGNVTGRNLVHAAVCAKQPEWKRHCQDAQAEDHLHRAVLWSLVYRLACGHLYGDYLDCLK